jgi:hypothetical protein
MIVRLLGLLIGTALGWCAWKFSYVAHTGDPLLFWQTMRPAIIVGAASLSVFAGVILTWGAEQTGKVKGFVEARKSGAKL